MDQKSIDEAKEAQEEYWGRVIDRLDYFRTADLDFLMNPKPSSRVVKIREMFEALPTLDGEMYLRMSRKSFSDGYVHLARYWLDRFMDDHVNFVWRATYTGLGPSDQSISIADDTKNGYSKIMQGRYP